MGKKKSGEPVEPRYLCPRCGERYLTKSGTTAGGRQRWRCRSYDGGDRQICYQTTNPAAPLPRDYGGTHATIQELASTGEEISGNHIVVTWAQNATPIHKGFFRALLAYRDHNKAALKVIEGRYKNPTSEWPDSQANAQWWASDLVPFLCNQRIPLNRNLVLVGDVRTQATAVSPLSGFEALTHGESGIFGHPRLQMKVVPTPQHKMPKILTTTGSVTIPNYTDSKAGKKGDFHHVLGAVTVQTGKDGVFHMRHLVARADGAFCDLDKAYYPDGRIEPCGPWKGMVFGDAHPAFADPGVVRATFGADGLVERLDPQQLVFHDLMDSYAVNPHHVGNPFISVVKRESGTDDVAEEVDSTIDWLLAKTGKRRAVIVPSNHDDMLRRYVIRQDWREDPINAAFYLETALHMVRKSKMGPEGAEIPDPFHYWVKKRVLARQIRCLNRGESHTIAGIECGLHGDQGPNGSRGSTRNLSRLGVRVIKGHCHVPEIIEGAWSTGTMTYLNLEYTNGISSWLNAHIGINPMGKRCIFICINGRFW